MRYYIIAGEASGDLHGSHLIRELRKQDPAASIRGWGGRLMESQGAEIVKNYRDLAFMGLSDVLLNLPEILRNFRVCKADILAFQPDALILIDYPGFNLRMAKWASGKGWKVIFYISPQIWAWKEKRVKTIRQWVDKMLVILPFEQPFYKQRDVEVEFVGHPLVELVRGELEKSGGGFISNKPVIALLPGSRKAEVEKKLPIMLSVMKDFPDYEFVVAQASNLEDEFIAGLVRPFGAVRFYKDRTYDILRKASAALVTSGTATLETALFGVPEVVCYKTSWLTYWAARCVIRVKYISLVNLIMEKEAVKELIQTDLNSDNLKRELQAILEDGPKRSQMKKDFSDLWMKLGDGQASQRAARSIFLFTSGEGAGSGSRPDGRAK